MGIVLLELSEGVLVGNDGVPDQTNIPSLSVNDKLQAKKGALKYRSVSGGVGQTTSPCKTLAHRERVDECVFKKR